MNTIYIVTGATGWVGRNILHELQLRISIEEFNDKVIAFGSKFQRIKSTAYLRNKPLDIPVYPLSLSLEIIPKKSKLLIIHSAFLTREKIKYFGLGNYINTNKLITQSIINIINESLESKVVLMSSGAADSIKDEDINEDSLCKDPYGTLKKMEEFEINKISECLILRIYGLTGKFIRDPMIFAFGNFLLSAKFKKAINISSKKVVLRSYSFAGDIAKVSIDWLIDTCQFRKTKIAAVSTTIDLLRLANLITNMYNLPSVVHEINDSLSPNIYIASEIDFISLLSNYKLLPTDLSNQIISTMDSIKDF